MRLLVLGASGLLGSNVVAAALARGWPVTGTYHTTAPSFDIDLAQADIRDADRVGGLVDRFGPDAIVNCAAMTGVDGCEANPELAQQINGEAPGRIAAVSSGTGAGFCHVSTDYVFDGKSDQAYPEDAEPAPLQVYGESKLAGERAVKRMKRNALVVRLSFVYGVHGSSGTLTGFPAWVVEQLLEESEVPLFRDQFVSPTRAGQAAGVICQLLENDVTGTYHIACRSCVTPYEFGAAVARRMDADASLLEDSSMEAVDRPARRPRFSCLDVSKLEAELDRLQPTLEEDLEAIDGSFDD